MKSVNMNQPNATESALRDESRCELRPLNRVEAGVAARIRQLCASPNLQNGLLELGLCEDLSRAASMERQRVKSKFLSS